MLANPEWKAATIGRSWTVTITIIEIKNYNQIWARNKDCQYYCQFYKLRYWFLVSVTNLLIQRTNSSLWNYFKYSYFSRMTFNWLEIKCNKPGTLTCQIETNNALNWEQCTNWIQLTKEIESPLVVVLQTRSDARARRPSFLQANPEPILRHNSIVNQKVPNDAQDLPFITFGWLPETLNPPHCQNPNSFFKMASFSL